jgi:hypothetical protein
MGITRTLQDKSKFTLTGLQVGLLEGALFNPAGILKISTTSSRYRYGWGETSGNALTALLTTDE